jgi:hypothetical protein
MSADRDSFPDCTLEENEITGGPEHEKGREKRGTVCNKRAPLNEMDERAR